MNYHTILFIMFYLNSIVVVFSQVRGTELLTANNENLSAPLYKNSFALLIGASNYSNGWPKLPGVEKDIQKLRISLETIGFITEFAMDPSKDKMESVISDFIRKYGGDPDNGLLFYFAGHGYTLLTPYGSQLGYIIPVDAPLPGSNIGLFQSKAIEMAQFDIYAHRIFSKHVLFVFDACFAGTIFESNRSGIPEYISDNTSKPVRQFITSGSANETVADQSFFCDQFIEGVNGSADQDKDGYITGTELGLFLHKNVTNYSKNTQHPQFGKIFDSRLDDGDFIFIVPDKNSIKVQETAAPLPIDISSRKTTRLEVVSELDGDLYLDATFIKAIKKSESIRLKEVPSGLHKISIRKADRIETKMMEILPEGVNIVTITMNDPIGNDVPEMMFVEKGSFPMGSDSGMADVQPVHLVSLKNFYISKFEITIGQFKKFIEATGYKTDAEKDNGSYIYSGGKWNKKVGINWRFNSSGEIISDEHYKNYPVTHVSWNDAKAYCEWLSGISEATYRLPAEAEWEFAAKGGKLSRSLLFSGSNFPDDVAWYYSNAGNVIHRVGEKVPNEIGLFDMSGNVWEWCADFYNEKYYHNSPSSNPRGPIEGNFRVYRGGCYMNNYENLKVTHRSKNAPNYRSSNSGFRIVREF